LAITSALRSSELIALRETLSQARCHTADVLTTLHLPTRDELFSQAQAMFARTRSLDEIVDRAYQLLLGSVGSQLDLHLQLRPQLV
jgi:stearoyl-CoA desaturase (delta-9 desaturase)